MTEVRKAKAKDVLIRALKTFWQASLAYLFLNIQVIVDAIQTDLEIGGFETLKSVGLTIGLGALAAGLSALYNGVIKELFTKPVEIEDEPVEEIDELEWPEDENFEEEDEEDEDVVSADDDHDAAADGMND